MSSEQQWFTQTFTIYYYVYYITTFSQASDYVTSVDSSHTSSSTTLSCQAIDSRDAYNIMVSEANHAEAAAKSGAAQSSIDLIRSISAAEQTIDATSSGQDEFNFGDGGYNSATSTTSVSQGSRCEMFQMRLLDACIVSQAVKVWVIVTGIVFIVTYVQ